MRIDPVQAQRIRLSVQGHLPGARTLLLFGSRVDDRRRGGDLDLYIETPRAVPLLEQAALAGELEQVTGLPVDLIIRDLSRPPHPIEEIARLTGVPL